uniref:Uncharacterized protein n=1 Tax=Arundo donax TaxID=35708 RepID=A0A0A9FW96_ARUDO
MDRIVGAEKIPHYNKANLFLNSSCKFNAVQTEKFSN